MIKEETKTPKHVIFLGAGASATSGYPLGDGLRRTWLASNTGLLSAARSEILKHYDKNTSEATLGLLRGFADKYLEPLRLFREGGFGTIDEFCYLIRGSRPAQVADLKAVMAVVFGLHSPEESFEESDYYPFIQRLFEPSDLKTLRKDIVVMSFNYDIYFDWLLRRAVATRLNASKVSPPQASPYAFKVDPLITSGFSGGSAGLKSLLSDDGFCSLKLHGMIAWPTRGSFANTSTQPQLTFDTVFREDIYGRTENLIAGVANETPIVFPWEVFGDEGRFTIKEDFALKDPIFEVSPERVFRCGGRSANDPDIHEIFKAIWTRARAEVMQASKVSFVGLSMHEYLNWGFRYLFRGKKGIIDLCVTDRINVQMPDSLKNAVLDPLSPSARILKLFNEHCPQLEVSRHRFRSNFAEFIQKDLGPTA